MRLQACCGLWGRVPGGMNAGGDARGDTVRRIREALLAGVALLAAVPGLEADFISPRKVSDTGGRVIQASAGVDLSSNAYVAWTAGGPLVLDIIGVQSASRVTLSPPGRGSGDPAIATNTVGTTFIVFTLDDPLPGGFGFRDVYLSKNPGGTFSPEPENLSKSPGDDYAPKLYLGTRGEPHLVWAQRLGNSPKVIYRPPEGPAVAVAAGDYPALAIDGKGIAYLAYIRARDLFSVNSRGGAFGREVTVTRTPLDDEYYPTIAVAESGTVFVAYERRGGLYYHESIDGGNRFGPPRLLDSGGSTPELRVTADPLAGETLTLAYEKLGDLHFIRGKAGGTLLSPVRVFETAAVESRPSLAVDSKGNLHLSYIQGGEVYYTNNTGQLTADFLADVVDGEVPLRVRFTDLSSGPVERYRWDFGDQSPVSSDRNPVHVYEAPRAYTVKLQVLGPSTQAEEEKRNFIRVQTPNNKLWLPDQLVLPGQKEVWYPLMVQHKDPIQGFEVVGRFDPSILQLQAITYDGTAIMAIDPEFFAPAISNEPSEASFYAGVIFDFVDPFLGQTLPPSSAQRLLHLIFDVSEDAPQGDTSVVEPRNIPGPHGRHNVFAVNGFGVLPFLVPSNTKIESTSFPLPQVFRRGNMDWNNDVELTDAVGILSYLFLGGFQPRCKDAADFDDSGVIDIADAIGLLSFLFLGGSSPAVPFPNYGLDPTPDDLGECKR